MVRVRRSGRLPRGGLVWCVGGVATLLAACLKPPPPPASPSPGGPPVAFLSVAAPTRTSDDQVLPFQERYGGKTLVLDLAVPGEPRVIGAFDDAAMKAQYETYGFPDWLSCMPSAEGDFPAGVGGPAGTRRLPGNYPGPGFEGSRAGGCGTWSTAICNRILGDTDPDAPVDQIEWNEIARDIKQGVDADPQRAGGSSVQDRDAYYRDKGYCVETKRYGGSPADRQELSQKVVDEKCDVKLQFAQINPAPPPAPRFINGHVEIVTGITARGIQTNSWGHDGYIQGGADGGFTHSDPSSASLWPPNQTRVTVSYVCKCGLFSDLF